MEFLKDLLKDLPNAKELEKSITEGIGKNFVSRTDFNTVNDTKKQLETDVKDRDTQLNTLKQSAGDNATLTKTIETLQAENKKKDDEYQVNLKDVKLTNAIKLALNDKVHNVDIALGQFDKTKLILGEDGKVTGLDEQFKTVQESNAFLFKQEGTQKTGFEKLGTDGQGTGTSNEQISNIFGNVKE